MYRFLHTLAYKEAHAQHHQREILPDRSGQQQLHYGHAWCPYKELVQSLTKPILRQNGT